MIDFQNASVFKLKSEKKNCYEDKIAPFLIDGEEIIASFKSVRDGVVFTNYRIIAINIQGVTGKRKDYTTLPYSKIQTFSIETSGVFDMDSELEIWFSTLGKVTFEFTGGTDVAEICRIISSALL